MPGLLGHNRLRADIGEMIDVDTPQVDLSLCHSQPRDVDLRIAVEQYEAAKYDFGPIFMCTGNGRRFQFSSFGPRIYPLIQYSNPLESVRLHGLIG
jgi:hypothetical protein